jgi:hypothetical protein
MEAGGEVVDRVVHLMESDLHLSHAMRQGLELVILDTVMSRWWQRWLLRVLELVLVLCSIVTPALVLLLLVRCSSFPSGIVLPLCACFHHPNLVKLLLGEAPSVPSLQRKFLMERKDLLLVFTMRYRNEVICSKERFGN